MYECDERLYQDHAESLPHDAVEEVQGRVSCHHEEVREEEVLSAAVVQQSVVLAAKQRLIGILERRDATRCQRWSPANLQHLSPLYLTVYGCRVNTAEV